MKNEKIFPLFFIFGLFFNSLLFSQTTMLGGRGLLRVQSAEVVGPINIYTNAFFLSFLKQASPQYLTKDYTLNTSITIGFSKNLELAGLFVPYQSDQQQIWCFPGNTGVGVKYHFPLPSAVFHIGLLGFFTFPTAEYHNIPFEPYSSGKLAWQACLLSTLDLSQTFPTFPMKFHINWGYKDNDIEDLFFKDEEDQMLLGAGVIFPIRSSQLYTEFTSEVFFNQPSLSFNQNSMRITQGFKFLGPRKFIVDVAFDIGLTNKDSLEVLKKSKLKSPFVKDYADWKMILGVTRQFSLDRFFTKSAKMARKREEEEERKLEKIRKKREKADEDLQKMREILEKKRLEDEKKEDKNKP